MVLDRAKRTKPQDPTSPLTGSPDWIQTTEFPEKIWQSSPVIPRSSHIPRHKLLSSRVIPSWYFVFVKILGIDPVVTLGILDEVVAALLGEPPCLARGLGREGV